MIRNLNLKNKLAALISAFVLVATLQPANAQKGGGGSTGGNGGGTIYFINGASYPDMPTNYMWSMDSNGGNVARLGFYGIFSYPSRALHGGHRYFLTVLQIPDSYYGDGTTRRSEVFAIRDDYDAALNNNNETRIQLTDDPTRQPYTGFFQGMHWFPGDQRIAYRVRRWEGSTPVDGGLYTADLLYSADGTLNGLAAQPTGPTLAFPLDSNGFSTLTAFSVDPTGAQIVYTDSATPGLWVANLSTGVRTLIYAGGGSYPDWSPDGTKIAFSMGSSIYTVKPNGTALKETIKPTYLNTAFWSAFGHPYFSPTGGYITCVGWTSYNGGTDDVFRATSSGGSLTNLSKTWSINEISVGWR